MKWASTLSRQPDTAAALEEAATAVEQQLGADPPDLLVAFFSPDHLDRSERIASLAQRRFPGAVFIGCGGGGVIGDAHEAEDGPAVSLIAAVLPGVAVSPFHVDMTALPPPDAGASPWRAITGAAPERDPQFLVLADPFTMDASALITGLDRAYPDAPKIGGLASGGARVGENRLLLGSSVQRTGAIGVALSGDVAIETMIAQGCRPIGKPMIVTRCHGGLLQELDQRRPIDVLTELYGSVDDRDRGLMRHSLFLGLEMHADEVEYSPGELLVRNLLGAEKETGAFVVGGELRPMSVVRFVLRDSRAADEELRRILSAHRAGQKRPPAGALLFSCLGRGAGLFGRPDHDTGLFQQELGPAPLGGFFCNGEIGPVGGRTFVHGYTSAFALFRERRT